jgi:hypothetical protein
LTHRTKKIVAILMLALVLLVSGQPAMAEPPKDVSKVPMTCYGWYCCFGDDIGEIWSCLTWFLDRFVL